MKRIFYIIPIVLAFGCNSKSNDEKEMIDLIDENVIVEYAFYSLDGQVPSKAGITELIAANYSDLVYLDSLPEYGRMKGSGILYDIVENAQEDFAPPDLEFLEHASLGLDSVQKANLQKSEKAGVLLFVCSSDVVSKTLTLANDFLIDFTKENNVVLWDSQTRQAISQEYWMENRLISDEINVPSQITIHFYQNGDYCRLVTLGLSKLGLPDLAMEDVSCYVDNSFASLINLTAQTLWERKQMNSDGILELNINQLRNKRLKYELLNSLKDDAEKKGKVHLIKAQLQEGDAENRLLQFEFLGSNPQKEQEALAATIFGVQDEVTNVTHSDEILLASERAKLQLPELKKRFQEGLPLGTTLMFKFPFQAKNGQNEWMWVEAVKWQENEIEGLLQNVPRVATQFSSGQKVVKNLDDMFDYMLYHSNGTSEGNETGELILKLYEK